MIPWKYHSFVAGHCLLMLHTCKQCPATNSWYFLVLCSKTAIRVYHISGSFGDDLNLAIWFEIAKLKFGNNNCMCWPAGRRRAISASALHAHAAHALLVSWADLARLLYVIMPNLQASQRSRSKFTRTISACSLSSPSIMAPVEVYQERKAVTSWWA